MSTSYFKITPEAKDVGEFAKLFREDEDFTLRSTRHDHLVVSTEYLDRAMVEDLLRHAYGYEHHLVVERLHPEEDKL